MSLTGPGTVAATLAALVMASVVTAIFWNRLPRAAGLRWPGRVALLVVCQLAAVAMAAVWLNDTDRFYNSWTELVGGQQGRLLNTAAPELAGNVAHQIATPHRPGASAVVTVQVPEVAAVNDHQPRRTHTALVYLPAAYFTEAFAGRLFPVIELFDGVPGSPQTWTGPMHLQAVADAEIAAGRAVPFIAVMPVQNYLPDGRDGECLDVPGGPSVESTLVASVRSVVLANFRASPDRRAWSTMGYSTGGYCALKIALRHPDEFIAAASILGNTSPYQDATTGPVFTKHLGLRDRNDPMWLATHAPTPDISVMLASARADPETLRQAQAFQARSQPPLRITSITGAPGGHNFQTFRLYEPVAFDWLSEQMRAPLAPGWTVEAR